MTLTESQFISTVEDPLKFFQSFFEFNYLEVLRKRFIPNPDCPEDMRNISSVDFVNETFTVEYTIDVAGHSDGDYWIVDEIKPASKTYSFREHLISLFSQEYQISTTYIDELLKNQPSTEKCKLLCQLWIGKILFYIGKSNEETFIRYKTAYEPLNDLVKYLLDRYPFFCPEPKSNPDLLKIHKKPKLVQTDAITKTLGVLFYKDLAELFDEDYGSLVDDDNESIEIKIIQRALMALTSKSPKAAPIIINFNWGSGPVNYILRKLKQYNKSMNLQEIENSGKVLIQKRKFTAGASYTAASRFEQHAGTQEALKKRIDILFSSI